jgi:hypothetical protein
MRRVPVLVAALASCRSSEVPVDAGDLARASEALGTTPIELRSQGSIRRDSECQGMTALVVPPAGAVGFAVGPGLYTFTGRWAVCDGDDRRPSGFSLDLVGAGRPPLRLLEQSVGASDENPADRGYDVMATFFAPGSDTLVLETRGRRGAKTALGNVHLVSSVEAPEAPPSPDRGFAAVLGETPVAVRGLVDLKECYGRETVLVHAPTQVRFRVEQGFHHIQARYGICEGAFEDSRSPTDGVTFRVGVPSGDGLRVLFERRLDPFHDRRDAGLLELALDEDLPGGDLVFETDPGPNSNSDWAILADVRIERSAAP